MSFIILKVEQQTVGDAPKPIILRDTAGKIITFNSFEEAKAVQNEIAKNDSIVAGAIIDTNNHACYEKVFCLGAQVALITAIGEVLGE